MSKKIVINETQLDRLVNRLNENNGIYSKTVNKIKDDLDMNYEPQVVTERRGGEYFESAGFAIKADGTLTNGKDLFKYLSNKYDDVGGDFLKQLIRDWADKKIVNGALTKNMSMKK